MIDAQFYFEGKQLLGKKAGGFLRQLYEALGCYHKALACVQLAATKEHPSEYIGGIIRSNRPQDVDWAAIKREAGTI